MILRWTTPSRALQQIQRLGFEKGHSMTPGGWSGPSLWQVDQLLSKGAKFYELPLSVWDDVQNVGLKSHYDAWWRICCLNMFDACVKLRITNIFFKISWSCKKEKRHFENFWNALAFSQVASYYAAPMLLAARADSTRPVDWTRSLLGMPSITVRYWYYYNATTTYNLLYNTLYVKVISFGYIIWHILCNYM